MRYLVELDGEQLELELASAGPGRYLARVGSGDSRRELELTVLGDRPTLAVLIGGRVIELLPSSATTTAARGARAPARLLDAAEARRLQRPQLQGPEGVTIKAPMPGRIVKVLVAAGDSVQSGQPALVIEAMKMENELVCARSGVVQRLLVKAGDTVERGALLIEIG
jgi:biotin carboxyl carrier protein